MPVRLLGACHAGSRAGIPRFPRSTSRQGIRSERGHAGIFADYLVVAVSLSALDAIVTSPARLGHKPVEEVLRRCIPD